VSFRGHFSGLVAVSVAVKFLWIASFPDEHRPEVGDVSKRLVELPNFVDHRQNLLQKIDERTMI